MPDTALAWAFWRALERRARRVRLGPVTLPTSRDVDLAELRTIVLAIVRIQQERS
jgi:hypothetical protein